MEFALDFFFTASLALLFSFLVAKLVSMAMAGDALRDSELKSGVNADPVEVRFDERKVEFLREEDLIRRSTLVEPGLETVHGGGGEQEVPLGGFCESKGVTDEVAVEAMEGTEEGSGAKEFPEESVKVAENAGDPESEGSEKQDQNRGLECFFAEKTEENPSNNESGPEFPINAYPVQQIDAAETERLENDPDGRKTDDDDWEGIERSDLEKVFNAATKFIDGEGKDYLLANVNKDVQLQLYGLYKIGTEGPCYEPQPMALKVSARAKWNAWQKLGKMSPEEAMEQYITLLSDNVPGWMGDNSCGDSSHFVLGGSANPNLTTSCHHQPRSVNESELAPMPSVQGGDTGGGSVNTDKE